MGQMPCLVAHLAKYVENTVTLRFDWLGTPTGGEDTLALDRNYGVFRECLFHEHRWTVIC
jgi:hypothetical protein